jgi:hypothetical protein
MRLEVLCAVAVLAGCENDRDRPPEHLAPVVIVTKSELRRHGGLEPPDGGAIETTCGEVMEHLNSALFAYEPRYMALAGSYATRVLASCHDDGWPDALKQCIVTSTPRALLDHACDKLVSDELAHKALARIAPGMDVAPEDFLRR